MDRAERLLALKRDFLVPCVYHFYRRPPVLARGEGAYLFDADGRRYLDCFSGVTVVSAGHSNPEIIEAAVDQLRRLQHTTTIYLTEPMLELARAIAELAPPGLRRAPAPAGAGRNGRRRGPDTRAWPPAAVRSRP